MRLKQIEISHYRSIKHAIIDFGAQTRLIGANGCGKSTVIRALDLFYAKAKTSVSTDDFFARDESKEIEIALTFCDFSAVERETFAGHISASDDMRVSRVFSANGGKANGRYHGVKLANPDFAEVRAAGKVADKKAAYPAVAEKYGLEQSSKMTEAAILGALDAWEAANPDKCTLMRDDGQFFGFEGVGHGKLSAATSFVFIEAVRDASQDAAEGKGAPITMLMDLIVRSAIEARPEIKAFRAKVDAEYQSLTDPAKLTELGSLATTLSGTLKTYYPDTAVELDWLQREALKVPLPNAAIRLNDDGFSSAVDRTGHGLQRALVMTLLQHLATASMGEKENEGDANKAEPDLVLAIEEPELYQHPTKQRHFARVLDALSQGTLAGLGKRVQIIYCSHSPMFIAMDRFDEVRLMRRTVKDGHREAVPCTIGLDQVANTLDAAHKKGGKYTAEGLRSRLHIIDGGVAEGFFSDLTVLVEGVSDKAAILATARSQNHDFEANEIAVVPVNGKNNIDRPAAIFRGLGIPTYAIWDGDEGAKDFTADPNRALQRLFGTADAQVEDAPERVTKDHACFNVSLENTLKRDLGADYYRKKLDEVKKMYDVEKDQDAQKSPVLMYDMIKSACDDGHPPVTLIKIVEAIIELRNAKVTGDRKPADAAVPADRALVNGTQENKVPPVGFDPYRDIAKKYG